MGLIFRHSYLSRGHPVRGAHLQPNNESGGWVHFPFRSEATRGLKGTSVVAGSRKTKGVVRHGKGHVVATFRVRQFVNVKGPIGFVMFDGFPSFPIGGREAIVCVIPAGGDYQATCSVRVIFFYREERRHFHPLSAFVDG